MTDLEITELCAEAMGWKHLGAVGVEPPRQGEPDPKGLWCLSGGNDWWEDPEGHAVCARCSGIPDPLHDGAQAMALVKRFCLNLYAIKADGGTWICKTPDEDFVGRGFDINDAICECIAKMQFTKRKEVT